MGKFAVIDTETNWADQVMSIGTVVADVDTFELIAAKYHILPIECEIGGMYYDTLFLEMPVNPILCTRPKPSLICVLGSVSTKSVPFSPTTPALTATICQS